MKCPCKDCKDRWVSSTSRCHAECDRYKEWHQKMQDKNRAHTKHKMDEDAIASIRFGKGKKQR